MARFVGIGASLCNDYTKSKTSSHECQNVPNDASLYASVPPPGVADGNDPECLLRDPERNELPGAGTHE